MTRTRQPPPRPAVSPRPAAAGFGATPGSTSVGLLRFRPLRGERDRVFEYLIQHGRGESAGERVLLADMVGAEQDRHMPVATPHDAVAEPGQRAWHRYGV